MLTKKEIKQRSFDKIYNNADEVACACGCGGMIKNKDKYGRDKKFISGHNGRKYEDPTEYKRAWNHRNRPYRNEQKKKYIRNRKLALLELSDNKCVHCGYTFNGTNECCFDFHHKDPALKKFNLNKNQMNKKSIDEIMVEFGKCELVCALCHRLIHNNYNEDN